MYEATSPASATTTTPTASASAPPSSSATTSTSTTPTSTPATTSTSTPAKGSSPIVHPLHVRWNEPVLYVPDGSSVIVSKKTTMKTSWLALAIALLSIAVILMLETPRESFVSPGKMFGPAIRNNDPEGVPIVAVQNLPEGQKVYLAEDDGYVKMVAANGQNGYFKGTLSEFDPKKWDTYKTPGSGYKLDVNDNPPPPPPPPPAPAATPGSYSAACTNCETIDGKVVCKCDVAPK